MSHVYPNVGSFPLFAFQAQIGPTNLLSHLINKVVTRTGFELIPSCTLSMLTSISEPFHIGYTVPLLLCYSSIAVTADSDGDVDSSCNF